MVRSKKQKTQTELAAEDAAVLSEQPEEEPENRSFASRVLEGGSASENKTKRKKLMKQFKKAKHIPSESEVERFTPDLDAGLSEEQVETRSSLTT